MLYQESQKLYTKETLLLLGAIYAIIFILNLAARIWMQNEGYSTPASMVVFPVVLFVFLIIIARYRLYTSVTYDSVTVKMIWRRRVVTISNIESVAVERFEMRKWQGYIRYRGSWCYISNAADKGLWITLKKGKPFMVSSATPEEFERAVNSARKLHRSQTSMD